jgi:hypothetical protein
MTARYSALLLAGALLAAGVQGTAIAQSALDSPAITPVSSGTAKATLTITAGPSGAPYGFTIFWMTQADFDANGSQWWSYGNAVQGEANYWGTPTLNTWDGTLTSFVLGPNESATVEIGDLFDETGVTTNNANELDYAGDYVFCAFANGPSPPENSEYSKNHKPPPPPPRQCKFTQGYWKNHPGAWPVLPDCGGGFLKLGTVCYTKAQLLLIFNHPAGGNGLVSLAHQLIAAKLNILNGADGSLVAATIAAADLQIGGLVVPPIGGGYLSPSSTSHKTDILDDFNQGKLGSNQCNPTAARVSTWGTIKALYR